MEEELLKAKKLESIGILAEGIAHEINNALVGITGNVELLKMDLPEGKGLNKYFEPMESSTHRMANLTDQLQAYARGGKYKPTIVSLSDFVENALPIIKRDIDPAIRLETYFPRDISNVQADLPHMHMVLSALLANASEAIEGEGRIWINTREEEIESEFTKHYPDLKPGRYVCLTVEDAGKGMDEETRSRIFEPFFTTKSQGRGLGMAAAYGIIRNHEGWISVDSELGKGTVIRIYLPAFEAQVGEPKELTAELIYGTGTVMVIEDEDIVMNATRELLERLGYHVLEARTGKEAINIAETFDGEIDLALLDIRLPDMEGDEVYPFIKKARPDLKVIVCSGYTIEGPAQEILDAGAQTFIHKPFSMATLSGKLREVLEGHERSYHGSGKDQKTDS